MNEGLGDMLPEFSTGESWSCGLFGHIRAHLGQDPVGVIQRKANGGQHEGMSYKI